MARQALGSGFGGRKRGIDSIISPNAKSRNKTTTQKHDEDKTHGIVTAESHVAEQQEKHVEDDVTKHVEEDVTKHVREDATGHVGGSKQEHAEKKESQKKAVPPAKKQDVAIKTASAANSTKKEASSAIQAKKSEQSHVESNRGEVLLSILDVEPNREQPRKVFDEEALQELAESIRQYGVLSPILVQKNGDYYEIIAGERRWRAAKLAGLKEVPVIIRDYTRQEVVEISLIENIQREDLNPIEEARAYKRLLTEFDLTQETVAQRVAKSRAAITNSTRLLKLDERVQDMLIDGSLTAGHARALLSVSDGELQYTLAQKVIDECLSVREVEKLVKQPDKLTSRPSHEKNPDTLAFLYRDLEERLTGALGTRVAIRRSRGKKGRIEISYHSDEELECLTETLMAGKNNTQ